MEREQLVKIVDEVAEGLMEGGPGSGRYPEGSGKRSSEARYKEAQANSEKASIDANSKKGNGFAKMAAHEKARDAHKDAAWKANLANNPAAALQHQIKQIEHESARVRLVNEGSKKERERASEKMRSKQPEKDSKGRIIGIKKWAWEK